MVESEEKSHEGDVGIWRRSLCLRRERTEDEDKEEEKGDAAGKRLRSSRRHIHHLPSRKPRPIRAKLRHVSGPVCLGGNRM